MVYRHDLYVFVLLFFFKFVLSKIRVYLSKFAKPKETIVYQFSNSNKVLFIFTSSQELVGENYMENFK